MSLGSFDPPLARQFAVRQLRLMREGLSSHEAFSKVEQEMAPRLQALKRYGACCAGWSGDVMRAGAGLQRPAWAGLGKQAVLGALEELNCACVRVASRRGRLLLAALRCRRHGISSPGSFVSLVQKQEAEQLDAAMEALHQRGGSDSGQGEAEQQQR